MKKSDKWRVIEWSVRCPYCGFDVDRNGTDDDCEEGSVVKCDECGRKFISGGWEV